MAWVLGPLALVFFYLYFCMGLHYSKRNCNAIWSSPGSPAWRADNNLGKERFCTTLFVCHLLLSWARRHCSKSLSQLSPNWITTMQMFQNAATWTVRSTFRYIHATPLLHNLYWLPVWFWINSRCFLSPIDAFKTWKQVTVFAQLSSPMFLPIPFDPRGNRLGSLN